MLETSLKNSFGPSRGPRVSVEASSTCDPKGAFPTCRLLCGAGLQPGKRRSCCRSSDPGGGGVRAARRGLGPGGGAAAVGEDGPCSRGAWGRCSGQSMPWSDGNPGSALGAMLLQGRMELGCLQKRGRAKRSPAVPDGKARGAVCNLEGVREFRVCLWFALPSSSSCFQRVGGIFVRPHHQQHQARVGLEKQAGTALCPGL